MLKKMMLLAVSAAALVAFAVPATASAATDWAEGGVIVKEGVDLTEAFEGRLEFTVAAGSSFGCDVTVKLTVKGPTKGEITQFNPTTSTCSGTGVLVGCKLKGDKSNVPWTVTNGVSTLTVTKPGGNLTIFNEYENCPALGASSDLEFASITVTPTIVGNDVTKLTISGVSTVGIPASGSVVPEAGTTKLGLK